MAKITDKSLLSVGTEIAFDTTAKTFTLSEAGNLVAKDGVTLQALYSKMILLWNDAIYNQFPFPMYAIDAKSGQFQFGTDGQTFNGWKPADDATRQMLRDGGWSEFDATGNLTRQYVGIVSLGEVSAGAQLYYQRDPNDPPSDFTFTDESNEGVQVYGDAANGDFDKRAFFRAFVREQGKIYAASTLADTGESGTGPFKVNVILSNRDDPKITDSDANIAANAPYTNIDVTYYATAQTRTIGGVDYDFNVIIDGAGATLEEIYSKVQYLLRQDADIDSGPGTVIGKTAAALCAFQNDTLNTSTGVFIDNILPSDSNRIVFVDATGTGRTNPFNAAGVINCNTFLTQGGSGKYRMYFLDTVTGDYGTDTAITVKDADGNDIAGDITAGSISFSFDYDGNVQGGRTAGTDAQVVVFGVNSGYAKPVIATATLTKSSSIVISLVAEQDRAYV